jgi:hypothetical protein
MTINPEAGLGPSRRTAKQTTESLYERFSSLPTWAFALALLTITLAKSGVSRFPAIGVSFALGLNPFANPMAIPDGQYLATSWLGSFLAWSLRIEEQYTFFGLHLFFSIAFVLLVVCYFMTKARDVGRKGILLFFFLPVSWVSFYWVGPDSLTLLLFTILVFYARHPLLATLVGIAAGLQHFEQSFVAFGATAVYFAITSLRVRSMHTRLIWNAAVLIGIVIGKMILNHLFQRFAIALAADRVELAIAKVSLMVGYFARCPHAILWSILGVGWMLGFMEKKFVRNQWPALVALICALLIVPFVGDETRVGSIITFPLMVFAWLQNKDFLDRLSDWVLGTVLLAWLLIPTIWVWEGKIYPLFLGSH